MIVPFPVLRLREDEAREGHYDTIHIDRELKTFAPPAQPLYVSRIEPASGYGVIRLPAGWVGDHHPSPQRHILFALAGILRVTASDGETRLIRKGDAFLMEDTLGKGHKSEVLSEEDFDAVIVMLLEPDQS
jgi:quercetin dioxygenase-like cupin family protein